MTGDRQAQYELYQLYAKAMFNTCLRIVNNDMEAEDVLQESFVSAFKNLKSYKGTASFGSWLKRIVVNNAINLVKKRKLDIRSMDEAGEFEEPVEEVFEPGFTYEVTQVKDCINLLPEGYRMVLSLYLLEGYDHKEIAGILGITESTSKSQFNRSKKKLREILKEQLQNAG
jgi:RNA polymerase sigma-70 factor (ECF subfamily)